MVLYINTACFFLIKKVQAKAAILYFFSILSRDNRKFSLPARTGKRVLWLAPLTNKVERTGGAEVCFINYILKTGLTFTVAKPAQESRKFAGSSSYIKNHKIKSVERKLDFLSFIIVEIISLFISFTLAATKVLIVKIRNASDTDNVPSAESFLPVKGKVSGPL